MAKFIDNEPMGTLPHEGLLKHGITYQGAPLTAAQQAYLDALDKYKDTEYYQQLLAYHAQALSSYNPSPFQKLAQHLGFRTGEYDFDINRDNAITSYLSQLGSIKREEEHNSVGNITAQELAAGINPNLQGVPQGAGQASEFNELGLPEVNDAPRSEDIANIAMSFLSTMMGLPPMVMDMKSSALDNIGKEMNLEGLADNYLLDLISGQTPVIKKGDGSIDFEGTSDKIVESIKTADFSKMPKSLRKYLARAQSRYFTDYNGEKGSLALLSRVASKQHGYASDYFSLGNILGDPRYSDDFNKMLNNVTEYFTKYQQDIWDLQKRYQDAQTMTAEDNAIYNNEQVKTLIAHGVPEEEARRQVSSLAAEKLQKEIEQTQNKMWQDVNDAVPKNKWYSPFALAILAYLRNLVNSGVAPSMFMPRPPAQVSSTNFDYGTTYNTSNINSNKTTHINN